MKRHKFRAREDQVVPANRAANAAKRFGLAAGALDSKPVAIAIWTTTPWTLPANQAVALHDAYQYSLLEARGSDKTEYLIVAAELAGAVVQRIATGEWREVKVTTGAAWARRRSRSRI